MREACFISLPEARKKMGFKNIRDLINKAHDIAQEFRNKETELIEILQQLDQTKAYRATGYNSLFQFCVESLQLTEHQAYQYITVARKCVEVPELMVALEDRRITVSKARKLSSVIDNTNQKEWISLAEKNSQKDLEQAVRSKDPLPPVRDHLQILSATEVKLQATIEARVHKQLARVMELLSERNKSGVRINQVLEELCEEYLHRHDPLRKAERALKKRLLTKKKLERSPKRRRLERFPKIRAPKKRTRRKPSCPLQGETFGGQFPSESNIRFGSEIGDSVVSTERGKDVIAGNILRFITRFRYPKEARVFLRILFFCVRNIINSFMDAFSWGCIQLNANATVAMKMCQLSTLRPRTYLSEKESDCLLSLP